MGGVTRCKKLFRFKPPQIPPENLSEVHEELNDPTYMRACLTSLFNHQLKEIPRIYAMIGNGFG